MHTEMTQLILAHQFCSCFPVLGMFLDVLRCRGGLEHTHRKWSEVLKHAIYLLEVKPLDNFCINGFSHCLKFLGPGDCPSLVAHGFCRIFHNPVPDLLFGVTSSVLS